MGKRDYEWNTIDDPPSIGRHSLNKHEVLKSYLCRYLDKLYARARDYVRFSIVDGFSGGGIYTRSDSGDVHYGSPILVMETVAENQIILESRHGKRVDLRARFYFVEKNKQYFQLLKKVLNEKGLNPIKDDKGGCINGEFVKMYPDILRSIKSEGTRHKAIFILDQYGYKDVPVMTMQQVFRDLPNAEIILTFAADWLIDYLSEKPSYVERCQRTLDRLGVDLRVSELLDIKKNTPYFRLLIQDLLSEELSKNCGAKYFTRYFIQTEAQGGGQSHRCIWLVHMSQHEVARDEMVKVHWSEANHMSMHSGFSGIDLQGLRGVGYTTSQDDRLGQLNLDYGFDDNAEKCSIDVLLNQLPDIIWKKHACTFAELMGEIANHTPVSSDIIRKVLQVLLTSKDIDVKSTKGVYRRRGASVDWTDLISARQKVMFGYSS